MINNAKLQWAFLVIALSPVVVIFAGIILGWPINITWVAIVVMTVGGIGLCISTVKGNKIQVYLNEKGLRVTGPLLDVSVPYVEIKDVVLRRNMDWGTRIGGYAGMETIGGFFHNKEFRTYRVGAYLSTPVCIVVSYDEKTLVFNFDSSTRTYGFYHDLVTKKESIAP